MSINRCMQCGCKSSTNSKYTKNYSRTHFFFSACVMLVHRCEPTKPHEHSAGYSWPAFLTHFGCSLLISFWFQLTFLRTFSFPLYHCRRFMGTWWRFKKCGSLCTMNICVWTLRHIIQYSMARMRDIWDVCQLKSGQLHFKFYTRNYSSIVIE